MTAQIAERLLYQGEMLSMCTNPLNDYFSMGATRRVLPTTALRFGVAMWVIGRSLIVAFT